MVWYYPSKLKAFENRPSPTHVLIAKDADDVGRKFFGWVKNHRELHQMIDQTDHGKRWYYENTERDKPCPLFFDIDGSSNAEGRSQAILNQIFKILYAVVDNLFSGQIKFDVDKCVSVLDASTSSRISMHVIVRFLTVGDDTFTVLRGPGDVAKFYEIMQQGWEETDMPMEVDKSVARVGAFRLCGCIKRKPAGVKSAPFVLSWPEHEVVEGDLPDLDLFSDTCVSYVPESSRLLDLCDIQLDRGSQRPAKFMRLQNDGRHVTRVPMHVDEQLPLDRTAPEAEERMREILQDVPVPMYVPYDDLMQLLSAYETVNPADDYASWFAVGRNLYCLCDRVMAKSPERQRAAVGRFFRALWHAYSYRSAKYDYAICESKWNQIIVQVDDNYDPVKYLFCRVAKTNYQAAIRLNVAVQYASLSKLDMYAWFGARLEGVYKNDPCQGLYSLNPVNNMWIGHGKNTSCIVNEFTDGLIGAELNRRGEMFRTGNLTDEDKERRDAWGRVVSTAAQDSTVRKTIDYVTERGFARKLDADPYAITFDNCILDLRTGTRRSIQSRDYASRSVGYSYAPCTDEEIRSVETVFKDILWSDEVYDWVMQYMSTCLLGQHHQYMVFFTGVPDRPSNNGSNGKSTFMNWIMKALGDYACRLAGTSLGTADIASPNAHTSHLTPMIGARAAYVIEIPGNLKLNLDAMIKPVTGGDTIKLRGLGKEEMEAVLPVTLFATCNQLPAVDTRDHATWRRLRAVWFKRWFADQENIDPNNPLHALKKDNLHTDDMARTMRMATMHVLLKHLRIYLDNDMQLPKCAEVDKSTDEFKDSTDELKEFLETHFQVGTQQEVDEKRSWTTFTEFKDKARRVKYKANRHKEFKADIEHFYQLKFVPQSRVGSRNPTEIGMLAQRKNTVLIGVSPVFNYNEIE